MIESGSPNLSPRDDELFLREAFPQGVGSMSVEQFRQYVSQFLIVHRGRFEVQEINVDALYEAARNRVDPEIRASVQAALNRRG